MENLPPDYPPFKPKQKGISYYKARQLKEKIATLNDDNANLRKRVRILDNRVERKDALIDTAEAEVEKWKTATRDAASRAANLSSTVERLEEYIDRLHGIIATTTPIGPRSYVVIPSGEGEIDATAFLNPATGKTQRLPILD